MVTPAVADRREEEEEETMVEPRTHLLKNCLEIEAQSPAQADMLRSWMDLVNGAMYPQPYLAEAAPGRFRLYVGPAAEHARTIKGMR